MYLVGYIVLFVNMFLLLSAHWQFKFMWGYSSFEVF